jgi:hypothetical protein
MKGFILFLSGAAAALICVWLALSGADRRTGSFSPEICENPRLTSAARPLTLAAMLMNALLGDIGSVVVVVTDGHAAGTCRA